MRHQNQNRRNIEYFYMGKYLECNELYFEGTVVKLYLTFLFLKTVVLCCLHFLLYKLVIGNPSLLVDKAWAYKMNLKRYRWGTMNGRNSINEGSCLKED